MEIKVVINGEPNKEVLAKAIEEFFKATKKGATRK